MISPVKIWRRQKIIRRLLGQKGKIISWTKIFVAGTDFKKFAPYFVVLVKLENKEKVVGQLVDFEGDKLSFGLPVKAILRKVKETKEEDVIPYGIKFKLM
jgi:uncharacterized OB-fold protein